MSDCPKGSQDARGSQEGSRGGGRLHLFDMDGTLIHGSSAALEISQQLGLRPEIEDLEGAFARGELSPPEFAVRVCALWSALRDEHVTAAFEGAPWLAGIREVWAQIRAKGERCAVISLSPDFFVRLLEQAPPPGGRQVRGEPGEVSEAGEALAIGKANVKNANGKGEGARRHGGADAAYGSRWPAVPFRDPVDPEGILSAGAKVRIADELCARYGVSRAQCVAYGDSMSDAELFAAVPVSVAVNADERLRALASREYRGLDLREAYALVR